MIVYDKVDYDSTSFIKPSKCFTTTFAVILLCLKTFFVIYFFFFLLINFVRLYVMINKKRGKLSYERFL